MTTILPQNHEKTDPGAGSDRPRNSGSESSHLAHDARNCLTVLRIYCDLLRSSGALRPGYEPWMDELAGAVERGQRLMDSLLDSIATSAARRLQSESETPAAASNAGFLTTHPPDVRELEPAGAVDIAAAVRRRLPVLKCMAGDKIRVEMHAPDHTGVVALSESDFERILYNLTGNAIEAMPQGGTLRILLNARQHVAEIGEARDAQRNAETISLCVVDSGRGIEPERLPKIFETGFSGNRNPEEHPERHGFGLAIVRELTELAGGEIRVYSQPGLGSRFEVKLPAA